MTVDRDRRSVVGRVGRSKNQYSIVISMTGRRRSALLSSAVPAVTDLGATPSQLHQILLQLQRDNQH